MSIVNILSLIILGVVLQIGGAYLVNAAVDILGEGPVSSASKAAMEYSNFMDMIRAIEPRQFVHIIFVGPLVEEIVFRLIFLRAGKKILPFWAANLIQAILFAIYHTVSFQRVYAFIMGIIIGCVFYYCPIIYRRSHFVPADEENKTAGLLELPDCFIGAAISFLLHVVINAAGLFIAPLLPADIAISLQIVTGTLLMAIAGAAVITLFRQSEKIKPAL